MLTLETTSPTQFEGHTPGFDPLPGLRQVADKLDKGISNLTEENPSLELASIRLRRIIAKCEKGTV